MAENPALCDQQTLNGLDSVTVKPQAELLPFLQIIRFFYF